MSNTFGRLFRLTTFGESHGPALGGVVDGCPPGIPLDESIIQVELDKRRPGQSHGPAGLAATPLIPGGRKSAWAQYSILAADEDARASHLARLKASEIPTAIYYPRPLHLQKAFAPLGHREGDFPVSEACARRIFSLPMHPYLAPADQERIASAMAGR